MIEVRKLTKKFGNLQVLKGLDCDIAKGEVISIIGPSGTGKSVFLRCLNLLETPTSGTIKIDGISLLDPNTDVPKLRQRMGMVFQYFNLYSHLSVLENLTLGPVKLLGRSLAQAQARGRELLAMVGLGEKADNYPDQLSGGQKQRVAIARCLAMDPQIILFDEPTSALDPTMVSEVLGVIRNLAKQGMTMVIVTHEMSFAENISSRVFFMDEGVVYENGPPAEMFENPKREKTRSFIRRVRRLNFQINSPEYDLYALNAEVGSFCEKHILPRDMRENLISVVEEVLALQTSFDDVLLTMGYSERDGELEFSCSSAGAPVNMLEPNGQPDDIGEMLIRARTNNLQYRYEDGRNILTMQVKHDPSVT
jgi:polar amino acid transport system ATP-binding protein